MGNSLIKNKKIYITGHNGMVGSACMRLFESKGLKKNIITKTHKELDLTIQRDVENFIKTQKPDVIINAAAKVGGIHANNSYPFEFLIQNMRIQNNLIESAHKYDVEKFIFLGSSCIYPKFAKQPITETELMGGYLEPTNQWYALAKISGVKLIESLRIQYQRDYVSLMPTNLYGQNDNFDLETSHVLPAMIRKFHEGKINNHSDVTLWGSGNPLREFLHVDDLASAVFMSITKKLPDSLYNVGYGEDISIKDLAETIKSIVGHRGKIIWDPEKPDGTPKKLMDSSKIKELGWRPRINYIDGIKKLYRWYLDNINQIK